MRRMAASLRWAHPKDSENIARLVNLAFLVEQPFLEGERTNAAGILELFAKGEFLLLEGEAALIGCVYLEPRGERSYLGLLAVDPQRQHAGLGSRLMAAAEEHCWKAGRRTMELTVVNLRTDLLRFYSRLGYVESGTEPFPAPGRMKVPIHLIRMTKDLRQDGGE
jgi:GNAT superfamily N-acetyltransferase